VNSDYIAELMTQFERDNGAVESTPIIVQPIKQRKTRQQKTETNKYDSIDRALREDYTPSCNVERIASELGISSWLVYDRLKKLCIERVNMQTVNRISNARSIHALAAKGFSPARIREKLGLSLFAVYSGLKNTDFR
jgi:hypothetical protein